MTNTATQEVIIIGGGLIGMLTARALLLDGAKVTIVDRGPFGGEASWAGGGILSPLYPWRYGEAVNTLAFRSQNLYPSLIDDVKNISSIDPEWHRCGLRMLDINDVPQAETWSKRHSIDLKIQTGAEAKQDEPHLGINAAKHALIPNVAQVRNPVFINAMQSYLQQKNAKLLSHTTINDIIVRNGRAIGIVTATNEELFASHIVVANGAWSQQLLNKINVHLPVKPVKGQMLLFKAKPNLLNNIVLYKNHYLIPRLDGHIIVGSTIENSGFDKNITEDAHTVLHDFACELLPALRDYPVVKQWSGLRPGCGQGIPYICEHPDISKLYINAGHFRNGIVMAPASAELLTSLILNKETVINPIDYSFHRNHDQIAL